MSFRKSQKAVTEFSSIQLSLSSPEDILNNSYGEVLKPETINYRTYKPERDGLFCEQIFGPTKDYECSCGKYKHIRYRGIICDRCGVEVTEKRVRRERQGHIRLVVPVAHIWYFRTLPNKIGCLLGLSSKQLEQVLYYERYLVLQPGSLGEYELPNSGTRIAKLSLLSEDEMDEARNLLGDDGSANDALDDSNPQKFIARMGAEAVLWLLERIDLDALSHELRDVAHSDTSQQRRHEARKRLQVVEAFRLSSKVNRPEWMILKVIPVIPPELRPLVPLDGGRFATSDLNDLYRRVLIRNNRLKRLLDIKAPEVILRNEKRMLQEAVDSLLDNSRKPSSVKGEDGRSLKSLSDSLKGKQGRFRMNLLGKRVDYSARSVIVVGPELKMGECGLPKLMAKELYKPFIIRRLIERGLVKTVKTAKRVIDNNKPEVWDILELVMKDHPVLLNRAPTLHRLGIQAFMPKMIEGRAIQLHPLACTAFNADFDGDQMAVHLPLSQEAQLEAQTLMLQTHNILNPSNGAPICVPSQDMVLGLYYITKPQAGVKGEGFRFYGPEEAIIALNERKVSIGAKVHVLITGPDGNQEDIETVVGRIVFNELVPKEVGYFNRIISKKSLRDLISTVINKCGMSRACEFLDGIKALGYRMAMRGGLSFNLDDIIIPATKRQIVAETRDEVSEIEFNYQNGFITQKERSNQVIDAWDHANKRLKVDLLNSMQTASGGFNSVFMMLDSGARGSADQIQQLSGMRGLMAKPQKGGSGSAQIIETPILSNFKEGMSVLEYFISTHGARKGLADTALKTADAGYLTRRLVDVAHDVVVVEEDCGSLRGLEVRALRDGDKEIESLGERLLGRTSLHSIYNPQTGELICESDHEIGEREVKLIEEAGIETVEVRSPLTCESENGVCRKCYGRNLATGRLVEVGEAVGVIAAQSIGEPGTQLTLRTFHAGGVAGSQESNDRIVAQGKVRIELEDLSTVQRLNADGTETTIVMSRGAQVRQIDIQTGVVLGTYALPYGSELFVKDKKEVEKGEVIAKWDPFNGVIMSEISGTVHFEDMKEGSTYRREIDESTGLSEIVVQESKERGLMPRVRIEGEKDERIVNLPVSGRLLIDDGSKIGAGEVIVKIPRGVGVVGDITGGLPRVTELLEARTPAQPALLSEIDGEVTFGGMKRGQRELRVKSRLGEEVTYWLRPSQVALVQNGDWVRAGGRLTDGELSGSDILRIGGFRSLTDWLIKEIQSVYRLQGVNLNDKHLEIIMRRMLSKVQIEEAGDSNYLEGDEVAKEDLLRTNRWLSQQMVVESAEPADDGVEPGMFLTRHKAREINSRRVRLDKPVVKLRPAKGCISRPILQGITRAALGGRSFLSAASFQETTKILQEAAIRGRVDYLRGMKENVITGHLIPAGTGMRQFQSLIVGNKEEYAQLLAANSDDTVFSPHEP